MGADGGEEGHPVVYTPDAPNFSLPVRCCPLLNAVVQRRMVLFREILKVTHQWKSALPCAVCAAGSRFRKMIAVSAVLHNYEAIELIQGHLEEHGKRARADLEGIKVWYQNELIPLRRIPFHGILMRGLDLPEPLLRAIYHGKSHLLAQQRTLDCILSQSSTRKATLYSMISESTLHDTVDALDYLLKVDSGFGARELLRYALENSDFYENPLLVSVRDGFRSVFQSLAGPRAENLRPLFTSDACFGKCCKRPWGRLKSRAVNITHLCLSVAVTAVHCDQYFM